MMFRYHDDGWRRQFAIIPFVLEDGPEKTFVWLRWYWARNAGLYTSVSLSEARPTE